jgi:hypothetical protein
MPILGAQSAGTKGSPTAPTIGTATLSGTTASVPFTAPSFSKLPITSYTVTSSPGGFTGTGASSPISVAGLSYNTAYTFSVTATTSNGTSVSSAASNSVTPSIPYWLDFIASPNGLLSNSTNIVGTSTNAYVCGLTYNPSFLQVGFLSKLNLNGTVSWAKDGTSQSSYINSVTVATSGNIYICGHTGSSAHITKVNSNGSIAWTRALSYSGGNITGYSIAIDSSENVYVAGLGRDSRTIYGVGFVVKYNSSGTIQWQRTLYSTVETAILYAVTVDPSGNVIVGGRGRTSGGSIGYLLAKYNSSGAIQWQKAGYTGSNQEQISTLTCDSSGNIYAGGKAGSGATAFLAKFDTNGTNSWVRQFNYGNGANTQSVVTGIGIDSSGNISIGGHTEANSGVNPYAFIIKYNSSGTLQLNRTYGVLNTTGTGSFAFGVGSDDTFYHMTSGRYLWHLPNDGSKTGTYSSGSGASMVYGTGFSLNTLNTLSNFVNGNLTEVAGQHSDSAGTLAFTDSVTTITTTAI